jgi:hypothetical protein
MPLTCSIHSGSSSLRRHVLRGIVALSALGIAFHYSSVHAIFSGALIVIAVIALGGCPGCWLSELFFRIKERSIPSDSLPH